MQCSLTRSLKFSVGTAVRQLLEILLGCFLLTNLPTCDQIQRVVANVSCWHTQRGPRRRTSTYYGPTSIKSTSGQLLSWHVSSSLTPFKVLTMDSSGLQLGLLQSCVHIARYTIVFLTISLFLFNQTKRFKLDLVAKVPTKYCTILSGSVQPCSVSAVFVKNKCRYWKEFESPALSVKAAHCPFSKMLAALDASLEADVKMIKGICQASLIIF